MAHTVEHIEKLHPEVQVCGGKLILYKDGKHIHLGDIASGGFVDLSLRGRELVESVNTSTDVETEEPKAEIKVRGRRAAPELEL